MPEAAIAHHREGALAAARIERRRAGRPQAVAHGGVAEIEGRQYREQVAADVAADVQRTELPLQQLHRRENRPLGAARAEPRRTDGQEARERLHFLRRRAARLRRARLPSPAAASRSGACLCRNDSTPRSSTWPVYSPARGSTPLPITLRLQVRLAQDHVADLLDELRLAFLDDQHRASCRAQKRTISSSMQRIGDVEHVERQLGCAERVGETQRARARAAACCRVRPAG